MTLRAWVLAFIVVASAIGSVSAQSVSLISTGAVWRFLDDGSDQGAEWRALDFDDSGWGSGRAQLGYGDGDEATVVNSGLETGSRFITTYFRHTFNVSEPACITNLAVRLLRDDGGVVYLNGVEIFRSSMPEGFVRPDTLAFTTTEENVFFPANAPARLLVAGQNVIAVEIHQAGPGSSDVSFDFELIARMGQGRPSITRQPQSRTALAGNPISLSVLAYGACPLRYQWTKDGVAIGNATNADLVIPAAAPSHAGTYRVVVTNVFGQVTSAAATVNVASPADDTFQVLRFRTNGLLMRPNAVADERGGIAVGAMDLIVNGNVSGAARIELDDFSTSFALNGYYDALVSNLRTEKIYAFADGTRPISVGGGTATTLMEVDGHTGAFNPNGIALSMPIPVLPDSGFFSGVNRVVVHNGNRIFSVAVPSGLVTDLGPMPAPPHTSARTGGYWGVAEFFEGTLYLVNARDNQTIVRTAVPGGPTESISTFGNLGNVASITVSLSRNRWYFHSHGSSEFSGAPELTASAEMNYSLAAVSRPPIFISYPSNQLVEVGEDVTLTVAAGGSQPLSHQWLRNGVRLAGATNSTLQLLSTTVAESGNYSVVVTNASGSITSPPAAIIVVELAYDMFDDFEPGIDLTQWRQFSASIPRGVLATNYGGSVSGSNSLWFGGTNRIRHAVTRMLDTRGGGVINFHLRVADGRAYPWEIFRTTSGEPDPTLEASHDGGATWFQVATYYTVQPSEGWTRQTLVIPDNARSKFTLFRWKHTLEDLRDIDHWAIDDVSIHTGTAPEIYAHPQSLTAIGGVGADIVFSPVSFGSLPLSYQWHFNGAVLADATNSTLVISNVGGHHAGTYYFVVSNALGTVTSSNAVLEVFDPVIIEHPVSQSLIFTETATFSVRGAGTPPLNYQWMLNGMPIPDATQSELVINRVTGEHAGTYAVVISNTSGTATSSNAVLEVADPVIWSSPESQNVIGGSRVELAVSVDGSAPLAFQWLFNGSPIAGATNGSLQITDAKVRHSGVYRVTISNPYATVTSDPATLQVFDPVILGQPTSRAAQAGGDVAFSVSAQGSGPLTFQWQHNGSALPGETNFSLVLNDVRLDQAGTYTVLVSNPEGSLLSDPATLRVFEASTNEFQIVALLTNNFKTIDHTAVSGGARGGIALSSSRLFYNGAAAATRVNSSDLAGPIRLSRFYDALVSNLRTETVYTLANGATPNVGLAGNVNTLIELDANTGALTTRRIALSTNIVLPSDQYGIGFFSGYDRALVHTGSELYHINLLNGEVVNFGSVYGIFDISVCANRGYWGVAEYFDGEIHLVAVEFRRIVRVQVPTGQRQVVAANLGDMCGFTISLSLDRWYFSSSPVILGYGDGVFRSPTPPSAARITSQPTNQTVLAGSIARMEVGTAGRGPLKYQWYHNGLAIERATNRVFSVDFVEAADAGIYSVSVSNDYGGALSSPAALTVNPVPAGTFQIVSLLPTGAKLANQFEFFYQRGMAVSATHVFRTRGPNEHLSLVAAEDLATEVRAGPPVHALVSNLRTEIVYALANGQTPIPEGGDVTVNALIPLESHTGALIPANRIPLSAPIRLSHDTGIFAGWDRIVLHNGTNVYDIALPSGTVRNVGAMIQPPHSSPLWAYWGIAESVDNVIYLVTSPNYYGMFRTRVPTGSTTELPGFLSLAGISHITAAPYRGRWYFQQYYGESQFGNSFNGALGFADARFIFPPIPPRITSQPRGSAVLEGATALLSVRAAGGAARLSYQWRFEGADIAGETNESMTIRAIMHRQAGQYSVVISNSLGVATSQVSTVTVRSLQGNSLRVTSLSTGRTALASFAPGGVAPYGGVAVSPTHAFYRAAGGPTRFRADDLSEFTLRSEFAEGLVSNLRNDQLYGLRAGTDPYTPGRPAVASLLELNGETAVPTGNAITLSQSIPMPRFNAAGIFSGLDRVVIHNGTNVYNIDLPSGHVTDLGPMPLDVHQICEDRNFYGVAEYFNGAVHLLYVRDSTAIARTRVPNGETTIVATFKNLGDTCTIMLSPNRSRWFSAHRFAETEPTSGQAVRAADATWDQPNTLPVIAVNSPQEIREDEALANLAITIFDAETSPEAMVISVSSLNPELVPLDNLVLIGSGTSYVLSVTPIADAFGTAEIVISATDAHGVTVSNTLQLVVLPVNDPPTFTGGPDVSLNEDTPLQVVAGWATGMEAGPPNEIEQSLSFVVKTDNPALFASLPVISSEGALMLVPAANAHGVANVTVFLSDNGGGQDTSLPHSFQISIQPVNDAPTASSQNVAVNEDTSVTITLGASDLDGDTLRYVVGSPTHGIISGVLPVLTYIPDANYFGVDNFTFSVWDGQAQSDNAVVTITIKPVNDAPLPVATLSSPSLLASNLTNYVVIALDNVNALATLNGSQSSDLENDPLQFFWWEDEVVIAEGPVVTNSFAVGSHLVTLAVSDGTDLAVTSLVLDVITPGQALNPLLEAIDTSSLPRNSKRPLIATLKAASASFDAGRANPALNQLHALENKIRAQIARTHPAEAQQWLALLDDVLSAFGSQ